MAGTKFFCDMYGLLCSCSNLFYDTGGFFLPNLDTCNLKFMASLDRFGSNILSSRETMRLFAILLQSSLKCSKSWRVRSELCSRNMVIVCLLADFFPVSLIFISFSKNMYPAGNC